MLHALGWFGRQGRFCLIAGLVVGLAAPALAEWLRPWIGTLVAVLLFITSLRVGARNAFGSLSDIGPALARMTLVRCRSAVACSDSDPGAFTVNRATRRRSSRISRS